MNRKQLRQLADMRLEEAVHLLKGGHPSGAYYLAGYAVECALKACIARKTQMHEFPDLDRVRESWTHKLTKLVAVAELGHELEAELARPEFQVNWNAVKDWSEDSRYSRHSARKARDFIEAVRDPHEGILTWLKKHW